MLVKSIKIENSHWSFRVAHPPVLRFQGTELPTGFSMSVLTSLGIISGVDGSRDVGSRQVLIASVYLKCED